VHHNEAGQLVVPSNIGRGSVVGARFLEVYRYVFKVDGLRRLGTYLISIVFYVEAHRWSLDTLRSNISKRRASTGFVFVTSRVALVVVIGFLFFIESPDEK
jgi:hypothetical protein